MHYLSLSKTDRKTELLSSRIAAWIYTLFQTGIFQTSPQYFWRLSDGHKKNNVIHWITLKKVEKNILNYLIYYLLFDLMQ